MNNNEDVCRPEFFKQVNFEFLPDTCTGNDEEVITRPIFPNWIGPSFLINTDFETLTAERLLADIVAKSDKAKEILKKMGPNVAEYIGRFTNEASNINLVKNKMLISLYANWFSQTTDNLEAINKMPFHADDRLGDPAVDISCYYYDTSVNNTYWSYTPNDERRTEYDLRRERAEVFAIEDIYDLINTHGVISIQRKLSGEVIIDRQQDVWLQARTSGVREGYYEVHRVFEDVYKSGEAHFQPNGYTEVLQKELHIIVPSMLVSFEMRRTPKSKPEKVRIWVIKKNDSQVIAHLGGDPQRYKGPFDPTKEQKKEKNDSFESSKKNQGKKRKSIWEKIFKK